jgi:hypothetical protein
MHCDTGIFLSIPGRLLLQLICDVHVLPENGQFGRKACGLASRSAHMSMNSVLKVKSGSQSMRFFVANHSPRPLPKSDYPSGLQRNGAMKRCGCSALCSLRSGLSRNYREIPAFLLVLAVEARRFFCSPDCLTLGDVFQYSRWLSLSRPLQFSLYRRHTRDAE